MFQMLKKLTIGILTATALSVVGFTTLGNAGETNAPVATRFDPLEALAYVQLGEEGHCSGVWVSKVQVLTARHCLMGEDMKTPFPVEDITLYDKNGSPYKADNAWVSDKADLASIWIRTQTPVKPATISCRLPLPGEHTIVAGFPLDFSNILSELYVAGYDDGKISEWGNLLTIGTLLPGNSGGPYYDIFHNVVAIVSSGINYRENPIEPVVVTDLNVAATLWQERDTICGQEVKIARVE